MLAVMPFGFLNEAASRKTPLLSTTRAVFPCCYLRLQPSYLCDTITHRQVQQVIAVIVTGPEQWSSPMHPYAPCLLPTTTVPCILFYTTYVHACYGRCHVLCLTLEPHRLSVPLLGLAYREFQYVLNRERQRKAAQTRLARRQARKFMGVSRLLSAFVTTVASVFCVGVSGL